METIDLTGEHTGTPLHTCIHTDTQTPNTCVVDMSWSTAEPRQLDNLIFLILTRGDQEGSRQAELTRLASWSPCWPHIIWETLAEDASPALPLSLNLSFPSPPTVTEISGEDECHRTRHLSPKSLSFPGKSLKPCIIIVFSFVECIG